MNGPQKQAIQKRMRIIKTIIDDMGQYKIKPKNFTAISEYIADRVSEIEGIPCSPSTIRRNQSYRHQLLTYMKEMKYEKAHHTDNSSIQTLSLKLRVRELEKENLALEKNLAQTLSELSRYSEMFDKSSIIQPDQISDEVSRICSIMYRLLQNLEGFKVDPINGQVIDQVTMMPVFSSDDYPEFFKWYNKSVGS